ncbi:MAG: gamma carbonic anhydrase family protein [Desulfocapsaceae bacterium]|jgi:carbonic anhydrase/acetyltransferase-like protein (isoleucine patch superfamily)|nr:gamma carbonic anhydrase family protein [Desulfocapsaceae bacterium]
MLSYLGKNPQLGERVFVAPGSFVIGDVSVGSDSSVFYNSVVRGDINSITIGSGTNIQDNCTLHVTDEASLRIGNGVTVGHNAVVHACTVGDNVLIGIGAVVLDGAVIADNCIVAAGSTVTHRKRFPAGSMIMGSPARVVRPLTEKEIAGVKATAARYVTTKNNHMLEQQRSQQ